MVWYGIAYNRIVYFVIISWSPERGHIQIGGGRVENGKPNQNILWETNQFSIKAKKAVNFCWEEAKVKLCCLINVFQKIEGNEW